MSSAPGWNSGWSSEQMAGSSPPPEAYGLIYFHIAVVCGLFYVNYLYLIPRLLLSRKRWWYLLSAVGLVVAMGLISSLYYEIMGLEYVIRRSFRGGQIPGAFRTDPMPMIMTVLAIAIGVAVRVTGTWLKDERQKDHMEKEKLNTELAFLKSQINPHFFFNTLNNLYSLALEKSDKTTDVIHKLSHSENNLQPRRRVEYRSLLQQLSLCLSLSNIHKHTFEYEFSEKIP